MIVQGNPCKRCSSTQRYKSGDCVSCKKTVSAAWYAANKDRKYATNRAWAEANPGMMRDYRRHYERKKRQTKNLHELLCNIGRMIEDHKDKIDW